MVQKKKQQSRGAKQGGKTVAPKQPAGKKQRVVKPRTTVKKVAPKKKTTRKKTGPKGPWKFGSVLELEKLIQAYFDDCNPHYEWTEFYEDVKKKGEYQFNDDGTVLQRKIKKLALTKPKPYTITGLALALDTTRETLIDYEKKYAKEYPEFSDTIKRAKAAIHNFAESQLYGSNATGPIFNLKNNWGWRDQTQIDNNHSGKVELDLSNKSDEELDKIISEYNDGKSNRG